VTNWVSWSVAEHVAPAVNLLHLGIPSIRLLSDGNPNRHGQAGRASIGVPCSATQRGHRLIVLQ